MTEESDDNVESYSDRSNRNLRTRVALLEEQIRSMRDATRLQAVEYERRLQELNHNHAEQIRRNSEYISREAYEMHHEQLTQMFNVYRDRNDARLSALTERTDQRFLETDRWRWRTTGIATGAGALLAMLIRALIKV